ncbi:ribose 5-phosphate isomerase B [candidate division GN15 bacterium]|uniref:Ribose 5-phosphate isomerase B n=1 Tax=candidate division GN15 bacterium TaxID=2072418 RepID=A0A855X0N7_9BACT|nr:MAG: ribose 5-phosphate isomerase B [candidate division GN15 bacterium]
MKVAIGADHKGFDYKEKIKAILKGLGIEVTDFGTTSHDSVDYPDYGLKVAHAVADGSANYGITVCWTGNGMNIAANKVKGIRSGLALNPEMAVLARQHNDVNVLAIASKYVPETDLDLIVRAFLQTQFEGGRHIPRVDKIKSEERC